MWIIVLIVLFLVLLGINSRKKNGIELSVSIEPVRLSPVEQAEYEQNEYARWKDKARPVLDEFIEQYRIVTGERGCQDPQIIHNARLSCIDLWYEYHATQEGIGTWVHSKEYMQQYLGNRYHPSMFYSQSFKEHLMYAEALAAAGEKKGELERTVIAMVGSKGEIMRCKLLKSSLCGLSPLQVESCCKYLLEKGVLVEYKQNNRYYYTLANNHVRK